MYVYYKTNKELTTPPRINVTIKLVKLRPAVYFYYWAKSLQILFKMASMTAMKAKGRIMYLKLSTMVNPLANKDQLPNRARLKKNISVDNEYALLHNIVNHSRMYINTNKHKLRIISTLDRNEDCPSVRFKPWNLTCRFKGVVDMRFIYWIISDIVKYISNAD
jgi:hypothetical protein